MHRLRQVMYLKTYLRVICLFLCSVIIWFLTDAAHIRAAAAQGLALCACSVIPALFPFLVISRLLISLGFATWISPLLRNIVTPLFRLPGIAGSALLLGLIGGYPIGAQTAADLYRTGQLTRQETERLLSFCNTSNPVFLVSVLGLGVFGSIRCGVWLWLIHLLSALLTGIFLRRKPALSHRTLPPSVSPPSGFAYCFVSAVRDSALAMLNVCAFVVLFYVLVSPFKTLPPKACAMLTGMEVPASILWIELDSTAEWELSWESHYGALEPGKYRICKVFTDYVDRKVEREQTLWTEFTVQ